MAMTDALTRMLAAQKLRLAGAPLETAKLAVLCLHGRGASAEDILGIAQVLRVPDIAYVAPQADGGAWYPRPFTEPVEANEPYLSEALKRIDKILTGLGDGGFGRDRVAIAGFSQGACLSLEYVARNAGRVAGAIGFSGGLIGTDAANRPETSRLDGLAVFLGCSAEDPFIPALRVRETAAHLEDRGAKVKTTLYPQAGHGINADEIAEAEALLAGLTA
ncbi:alpha/beta hydrolase [Aurantimonas sp. VKM B-3413]|uniref:alpha/beta hydrolase n=1 Tax=Aurantimonas sp. VKM B-3413 TaxID=2779401 RepID=UPI001E48D04B|nr:dienelactone hydrolase family protein [Aurantimonas sp. VKM B-3413]MCB8838842.1 dienelactone hydrolase family protein [Aurantimonas sp. VKM B-3413]